MATNTPTGPKALYPDTTYPAQELIPEALIFELATIAGNIEGDEPSIRVPYIASDQGAGFVPEGSDIPESDPDLAEILVNTGKLAILSKISNEARSYPDARDLLSTSMRKAMMIKANTALLSNASDPTGLHNVAGIEDAGTLGDNLDAIGDAITAVEVNGGQATGIVTDPASWGVLRALKTATGSAQPLLGAPADQTERRLFGVPVIVSAQAAPGSLLVVDRSEIIAAAGELRLAVSEGVYFGSDSYGVRLTWRMGWNVIHPNRLAKVAITLPAAA